MFLFVQPEFPSHNNNEFCGYVTFTPARKTSQQELPRRRFMMCSSMHSPSVSPNNCQLNHMALAHMKLTPALPSRCPDFLPHVCIHDWHLDSHMSMKYMISERLLEFLATHGHICATAQPMGRGVGGCTHGLSMVCQLRCV